MLVSNCLILIGIWWTTIPSAGLPMALRTKIGNAQSTHSLVFGSHLWIIGMGLIMFCIALAITR